MKRGKWTLWAFRVAAAVFIPLLCFGALELGLRAFGYGYPTDFFLRIRGRDAYTINPRFGWRFFPPEIARRPEPCSLPARKGSGTFRIFVLGESAAMGTPEPAFGFGRILEAMLRDRYPGIRFEVVNAAMTAVNSHVLLPVARACAAQEGDLFVVYAGNNEVVGPYGAGTVFQAYAPDLAVIRAGIWAKTTRIGQWVESLTRRGRDQGLTEWQGMEMFLHHQVPADDPRLEKIYQHFQRNLTDICEAARGGGGQVIVCTVATNLKDSAPFASLHRSGLTSSGLTEWERLYRSGIALAESGQHARAVEVFLKAVSYDDRFADLHFRLGRSYLAMGRVEEARGHFIQARDMDALRFRADTRINEIIRQVAGQREAQGIFLIDAERAFSRRERTPIPGQELFYEHVHLNFDGNDLLARTVFDGVSRALRARFRDRAPVPPPSQEACQERVALTDWNRYRMQAQMAEMMDHPPFTHQLDYERDRLQRYRALKAFRLSRVSPAAPQKARAQQVYQKAVERDPEDLSFRQGLIHLLQERRDYAAAAAQCRVLLERIPDNPWFHGGLGDVLSLQGKAGEAIAEYRGDGAARAGAGRASRPDRGHAGQAGEVLRGGGRVEPGAGDRPRVREGADLSRRAPRNPGQGGGG